MTSLRCTGRLLGCSCIVVTALVLYAWEGYYVDTNSAVLILQTPNLAPNKALASRNLMSRRDADSEKAVRKYPAVINSPMLPSVPSLRTLLEKSTSKLQCASNKYRKIIANITEKIGASHTGFILVASFREQQTKASDNLFGLQCWAKSLPVRVVEPYVENSHLVVPLTANATQLSLLRYRDLFDIEVWQLLSAQHGFPPLASWDTFLATAPRQLIVVRFKYLTVRMQKMRMGKTDGHLAVDSTFKEGCPQISLVLSKKIQYLTATYNFEVIREVCFNFAEGDQLTPFQFNRHLYGDISLNAVTVLMEEWRGLGTMENGKRVMLLDACSPSAYINSLAYTWPSRKLICDAKKYKQRYLKTSNYISLMVRTEKIVSLNTSQEYVARCLNETLSYWKVLKNAYGIEKTFLSMDIGEYGSYSLVEQMGNKDSKYTPFTHLYDKFLRELFGPETTLRVWELGFMAVSSQHDSGYIGSLQKTIAAQGRCIVFTGGGSFQKHSKYIYERLSGKRKQCSKIINKCSRGMA